MASSDDQQFPAALTAMSTVEFFHGDDEWIDFEPLSDFESTDETTTWLRTWTGNPEITGAGFRVFAAGFSPWDVTSGPGPLGTAHPRQELMAVAERFAPGAHPSPDAIVAQATNEFPEFDDFVAGLCS